MYRINFRLFSEGGPTISAFSAMRRTVTILFMQILRPGTDKTAPNPIRMRAGERRVFQTFLLNCYYLLLSVAGDADRVLSSFDTKAS